MIYNSSTNVAAEWQHQYHPRSLLEKQISSPHHRPTEVESLHPGIHAVTTCPGDSYAAIVWEALVLVWIGAQWLQY